MPVSGASTMGTFLDEFGVRIGVEAGWTFHLTMPGCAAVLVLVVVDGAGLAPLRKARPLTDGAGAAVVVGTPGISETTFRGGSVLYAPALSVCEVAATGVVVGAGAVSDAMLMVKCGGGVLAPTRPLAISASAKDF